MSTYNITNTSSIDAVLAHYFGHGEPEVASIVITEVSTDFQIVIAPHPAPANGYLRPLYYNFYCPAGGSDAVITIWDEDLTVGTAADARGSTTAPLHEFIVPAGSNLTVVPTPELFQAGIAVQSTIDNVHMSVLYAKFIG